MTFSTSAVAVCCCSDSSSDPRSAPVPRRTGARSRSRYYRLIGEGRGKLDVPLPVERLDFFAGNQKHADNGAFAHEGHSQHTA